MHSGRWQWRGPFLEYCRLAHTQPSLQKSQPHSGLIVFSTGYLATFKIWLGCICVKNRFSKKKTVICGFNMWTLCYSLFLKWQQHQIIIPLLLARQKELHRVCLSWAVFGSDPHLVFQSPSPTVWTGTCWWLKIDMSGPGLTLVSGCTLAVVLLIWRHKMNNQLYLRQRWHKCD